MSSLTTTLLCVGHPDDITMIDACITTKKTYTHTELLFNFAHVAPIPALLNANILNRSYVDDGTYIKSTSQKLYDKIINAPEQAHIYLSEAISDAQATEDLSTLRALLTTIPQSLYTHTRNTYSATTWQQWCQHHWGTLHAAYDVKVHYRSRHIMLLTMTTDTTAPYAFIDKLNDTFNHNAQSSSLTDNPTRIAAYSYHNPHHGYSRDHYDPHEIFKHYIPVEIKSDIIKDTTNPPPTESCISDNTYISTHHLIDPEVFSYYDDLNYYPRWNVNYD